MTATQIAWIIGTTMALYMVFVWYPRAVKIHMAIKPTAERIDLLRRMCAFDKQPDIKSVDIAIRHNNLDSVLRDGWRKARSLGMTSYRFAAILNTFNERHDGQIWLGSARNDTITLRYNKRYVEIPLG